MATARSTVGDNPLDHLSDEEVRDQEEEEEEDEDYIPLHPEEMSGSTEPPTRPVLFLSSHRRRRGPPVRSRRRARRARIAVGEGGDAEGADADDAVVLDISSGGGIGGDAEEGIHERKKKREESICEAGSSQLDGEPSTLPNCPICLEQWTSEGVHRICCIPCGHVYGRSCLERWVQRCLKSSAKCPQCNRKFNKKQIINLYAPRIVVANDDLEKEVKHLHLINESLISEKNSLLEEVRKHKMLIMEMERSERQQKACMDHVTVRVAERGFSFDFSGAQGSPYEGFREYGSLSQNNKQGSSKCCNFALQIELDVCDARVLDVDSSSQIMVLSRASSGLGREDFITKVSMLVPYESESILLPSGTGAIRDLHIAPPSTILTGRLALLASLGKKLSVFSMETNSVVLKYELPSPAWSCSWDPNNPDFVYTGLQNGMLMVFDIRQTARPLHSHHGLSCHPVHTICSFPRNSVDNSRTLITASSIGPCIWDKIDIGERPCLISGMESHGVCISLACGGTSDAIVASFRPKVLNSNDSIHSQFSQPCSPTVSQPIKYGNHVLFRKSENNCYQKYCSTPCSVSEVRLSRSAILSTGGNPPLFTYGHETFRGLFVFDMPSLQVIQRLKPHPFPILDVKYSPSAGPGLLGCVSKTMLQVFACSEV